MRREWETSEKKCAVFAQFWEADCAPTSHLFFDYQLVVKKKWEEQKNPENAHDKNSSTQTQTDPQHIKPSLL
ncbi:MAG: hypothetical protein JNM41_15100 [Flavipsychrobacter sp.]|nr:hypothetical protein [Flavipsychrobacter sp.]